MLIQSLILGIAFLILVLFHIWEEYLKEQRGEVLYIRRATNKEYKRGLLSFYNWLLEDQGNPIEALEEEKRVANEEHNSNYPPSNYLNY
jgi:hypothetical protein